MIPTSSVFDQSVMTAMLDHDPVVAQYRAFFSFLDWSLVEHFQAERSGPGRPAHPESAYLKAFLIRQNEGFLYTSQLRRFLLRHPLLVIDPLQWHLEPEPCSREFSPFLKLTRGQPGQTWSREPCSREFSPFLKLTRGQPDHIWSREPLSREFSRSKENFVHFARKCDTLEERKPLV